MITVGDEVILVGVETEEGGDLVVPHDPEMITGPMRGSTTETGLAVGLVVGGGLITIGEMSQEEGGTEEEEITVLAPRKSEHGVVIVVARAEVGLGAEAKAGAVAVAPVGVTAAVPAEVTAVAEAGAPKIEKVMVVARAAVMTTGMRGEIWTRSRRSFQTITSRRMLQHSHPYLEALLQNHKWVLRAMIPYLEEMTLGQRQSLFLQVWPINQRLKCSQHGTLIDLWSLKRKSKHHQN